MFHLKCTKFNFGWDSAADPSRELTALPDHLGGYGIRGRERDGRGRKEEMKGRVGKVKGRGRENFRPLHFFLRAPLAVI